jgi:hypothetical protein
MTFRWPFGRHSDPGWRDVTDDPLPARLHVLGGGGAEIADRVTRQRGPVLAEFAARQVAPVASSPWRPRRLAYAMVTATLLLAVTAGGIAASGPGLPAYPIRLAVEELLLPAGAAARLEGQLGRLERRLAEASSASNASAVSAALEAYERIAAEVVTMARPAGVDGARLEARITEQLRSLQRIGAAEHGRGAQAATRSANGLLLWLGADDSDLPMPAESSSPAPAPATDDASSGAPIPDDGGQASPFPGHGSQPGSSAEPHGGHDEPAGPINPPRRTGPGPN